MTIRAMGRFDPRRPEEGDRANCDEPVRFCYCMSCHAELRTLAEIQMHREPGHDVCGLDPLPDNRRRVGGGGPA